MDKKIAGLHHVTAIASDPQRNLDFYIGLLGLRLVKRTVNFDDPGSYHFYFGDETGSPRTLLTFFPSPPARRRLRGRGARPARPPHPLPLFPGRRRAAASAAQAKWRRPPLPSPKIPSAIGGAG